MKLRLVRVGNSRGLRLPKTLLDEAQLADDADLEASVTADGIMLRRVPQPRAGWAEAAKRLRAAGDDTVLDTPATAFDAKEWTW